MRIRLYGRLADLMGRQVELDSADGSSVAELKRRLADDHPSAAEMLGRSRAYVGSKMISDDRVPAASDDVEFLPPVSGG